MFGILKWILGKLLGDGVGKFLFGMLFRSSTIFGYSLRRGLNYIGSFFASIFISYFLSLPLPYEVRNRAPGLAILSLIPYHLWRNGFFLKRKVNQSIQSPLGKVKRLHKFKSLQSAEHPDAYPKTAKEKKSHIFYIGTTDTGLIFLKYNKKDRSLEITNQTYFEDITYVELLTKTVSNNFNTTKSNTFKRTIIDESGRVRTEEVTDEKPETHIVESEKPDGIRLAFHNKVDKKFHVEVLTLTEYKNDHYLLRRLFKKIKKFIENKN